MQKCRDLDPPVAGVVPVHNMTGEGARDTMLLQQMSREAEEYLRSYPWCDDVQASFFGGGVGGIFAVFLFRISSAQPDACAWNWIVVGDVPFALIPLDDADSPVRALEIYLRKISKWVAYARSKKTGPVPLDIPRTNIPATEEWAEKIEPRLNLLRVIFDNTGESGRVD
jgi:hypothetical protein